MIYGLHWVTEAASKCGRLYTCSIYEPSYVSAVVPIPAGNRPFEQNVLASSDDPFDPILASELKINLDITGITDIPDLTTRNDRKYLVKLTARDFAEDTTCKILWKMYETSTPTFIDANLKIWVNGINVVTEFIINTGSLIVNSGDNIYVENVNLSSPTAPTGGGWKLQIQKDGSDIYNNTNTVAALGTELSYSFVAGNQNIYEILCCSYQIGDNSQVPPVTNSYEVFQGWVLMDSSRLSFTTGRIFLDLSVTDGLAMLKSILYNDNYAVTTADNENGAVLVDINTTESLLTVCLNCLNKLSLANGFHLNIACDIYATSMVTTSDPFSQILYYQRNWLNSDMTFMDCYTILQTIVKSFGCQIFQAGNEYWIANVNDRCADLRYFKYDQTGALVSSGTLTPNRTIKPYVDSTTTPHHFIDNSQAKTIRKGYPVIDIKSEYKYAPNLIDNGNLKRPFQFSTTEVYYNWEKIFPMPGTSVINTNHYDGYNWVHMDLSTSTTIHSGPTSVGTVSAQDLLTLSFLLAGRSTPSSTIPAVIVSVKLTNPAGTDVYYLDNSEARTVINGKVVWLHTTVGCNFVVGSTTSNYESISVNMPPCPIDGLLEIRFILTSSTAVYFTPTLTNCEYANVVLSATNQYQLRDTKGYDTLLSQYKKDYTNTFGYNPLANNTGIGAMLRSNATYAQYPLVWTGWYRYGITESYATLPRLIIQQYINCLSAAQINIDGDIMSLFGANDASVSGMLTLIDTLKFLDTTSSFNVNGFHYIFGNCRINYTDDTISGTFLNVSNTDITETITDIDILKSN